MTNANESRKEEKREKKRHALRSVDGSVRSADFFWEGEGGKYFVSPACLFLHFANYQTCRSIDDTQLGVAGLVVGLGFQNENEKGTNAAILKHATVKLSERFRSSSSPSL